MLSEGERAVKFPPDTKFTINCEDMGQLFDSILALRILLAGFVRDSTRPQVRR